MLRKIECYLMASRLEKIRDMLINKGVEGMSVLDAMGVGTRSPKGKDGKPMFEKRVKVEIVVDEARVDNIVREIRELAGSGSIGAGMIFVSVIEDAIRLSTRESGSRAIV